MNDRDQKYQSSQKDKSGVYKDKLGVDVKNIYTSGTVLNCVHYGHLHMKWIYEHFQAFCWGYLLLDKQTDLQSSDKHAVSERPSSEPVSQLRFDFAAQPENPRLRSDLV